MNDAVPEEASLRVPWIDTEGNRVGTEEREEERIHSLVMRIHDDLVLPSLGKKVAPPSFPGQGLG